MEVDANKLLTDAMRSGIQEAIKHRLTQGYGNPFDKIIADAIQAHAHLVREAIDEATKELFTVPENRAALVLSFRTNIAKSLIQKFGGEIEKQVNALKSDPATRARITLAIEEIVKQGT